MPDLVPIQRCNNLDDYAFTSLLARSEKFTKEESMAIDGAIYWPHNVVMNAMKTLAVAVKQNCKGK